MTHGGGGGGGGTADAIPIWVWWFMRALEPAVAPCGVGGEPAGCELCATARGERNVETWSHGEVRCTGSACAVRTPFYPAAAAAAEQQPAQQQQQQHAQELSAEGRMQDRTASQDRKCASFFCSCSSASCCSKAERKEACLTEG
jgi:hypothetical protein